MSRHRLASIGYLIVAAILGHELLMAGDAHGQASPKPHELRSMTAPATGAVSMSGGHHRGDTDCGSLRAVLEKRAPFSAGFAAVILTGMPEWSPPVGLMHVAAPRTLWPPGVRRAFLQVYRI